MHENIAFGRTKGEPRISLIRETSLKLERNASALEDCVNTGEAG